MRFDLSPEQSDFAAVVRKFLDSNQPMDAVRRQFKTADGFDRDTWRKLAQHLGVAGMAIPEQFGGEGQTLVELGIVMREAGRALSPMPFLASAGLATQVLLCSGDEEAKSRWLPRMASGEVVATAALTEVGGQRGVPGADVVARRVDGDHRLFGQRPFVLHGQTADLVLVTADTENGASVFVVEGDASGLSRRPERVLDHTRPQASLRFDGVPARLLGEEGSAGEWLGRAVQFTWVLLAKEQVGAAERCLEMAVAYASERHQFGRPIGSFQAVKHMCADALVDIESARAAADYAAVAAAAGRPDLPAVASLASAFCSDAFYLAASQNIQIHGGLGFTWEHDAHLYYKRATATVQLFGSPAEHREQLASLVLD